MEDLSSKVRVILIKNVKSHPDTIHQYSQNIRITRLLDLLYLIDSNAHMDEVALTELLSEIIS